MKTSIISSETLSEFATFCRDNELDIGVNITKDSVHLLEEQEINSLNQAIYYLQFLFVNSKQDIEKYKFLASKFFNQNFSLQNNNGQSDYTSLLSKTDKEKIMKNSLFIDYLLVPDEEKLKLLSYDIISSFESLDFSRPVSINYWVERIMSSSAITTSDDLKKSETFACIEPVVLIDQYNDPLLAFTLAKSPDELSATISPVFEIDSFRKKCLLEGLDDIDLSLEQSGKISSFEENLKNKKPWIFND